MNRKHLKRLPALSRKLARTLFHTMGRHQHKLEREQMLIGGLVDIGTWLFACSSVLAYTEALALRGNSPHCQELANHFCQLAFEKIDLCFNEFGKRPVHSMHVVTDSILHNHYDWLENGIISTTEQTETRYPNLAKINVMDEKSTHIKF